MLPAKHCFLQILDIEFAGEIVHFLTKLANAVTLVALFPVAVNLRNHLLHRRISVKQTLKPGNLRCQRRDLGCRLRRRQQEENRVQVTLLGHNAVRTKVVGQNRRGHAEVLVLAGFSINARRR